MKSMKRIAMLMAALICWVGVSSAYAQSKAKIEAPETEYNFGKINEADGNVEHVFRINNTGTAPLVVTRVISSCGCTIPKFSRDPIAPGKSGSIIVVYNPTNRVYPFVKTVSVYSNGKEGPLVLTIKGEVVK